MSEIKKPDPIQKVINQNTDMGFLRYQSLAPAYDDGSLQKDVDYESYKKLGDASDRNQFIRDMEIVKQGLGLKGGMSKIS